MKRLICLALISGFLGTGFPALAGGLIIINDAVPVPVLPGTRPPIHEIHRTHVFAPLEVESQRVETHIKDQVAVTSVDQEFYNPNSQRLEGTFVFPIPKGAQIDQFTMEIDGKRVQAELLAADKARGIYEDIVRRQRDPALMEYAGRDVLKVRIFPIEPRSKKRISLSYTQVLKFDSGLIDYVLPLDAGKYSAKPIKSVSVKVDVETKRPLKSIYSPSHTVEIRRDGPNKATAGYEAADVQPSADFQLYFAPEKDEIGVNLLTYKAADEDGFFLLLASPGLDVQKHAVQPKDVVLVLDTSGSMAGDKLKQAKKALEFCVENLNDHDRFEVIRFSTEVEPLFNKFVEASPENRARARGFVKDLKAIGATAIDDALHQALALEAKNDGRPSCIIFLTDGMPTIGVTDEDKIVAAVKERNAGNRRVFCFGIGVDVNTHLLDRISEETRAASEYVLPEEDIEVKVSRFFAKIKEPVLANPAVTFTGGVRAGKFHPNPLPDLFKGEQLVLVGRYSGKGASAAVLEGAVDGQRRKFSYDVDFPAESSGHEFIARLWATRRVGYLLDQIRLHGENAELKDEAAGLARKYGIVTPYTAYLIVEDEARRGISSAAGSLPGLSQDSGAREEAAKSFMAFRQAKDGASAIFSARAGESLADATVADAGIQGGKAQESLALNLPSTIVVAGAPAPAPSAAARMVDYTQQARFVGGRNFFQNDGKWIDAGVQLKPDAKRVRIQFGSAEYFALLKEHPEAGPWLALGGNVQFVLGGSVYEVSDGQ